MPLRRLKMILTPALLFCAAACSTVTAVKSPQFKSNDLPNYEKHAPFFLWGLVGKTALRVEDICGDRGVNQIVTQQTFTDGLFTIATAGLYSPRTIKAWCE